MPDEESKNGNNYEQLLEEMALGGCTLILGPEFCVMDKAETIAQSICDFIADKYLPNQPYISEDGFFYTNKTTTSSNFFDLKVKEFYRGLNRQEVPGYYNLIAQLPFKFIISLSPDDLLHRAFNDIQKKHSFVYFRKGAEFKELVEKEQAAVKKPGISGKIYDKKEVTDSSFDTSPEKPLLFNLMGIYDDEDSLVVTHNALFEFLYSVFPPEQKLKDGLKDAITKSTSFLCLGFQYNKWYLKIIFFIIKKVFQAAFKEDAGKTAIFVSSSEDEHQKKLIEITKDFYENQFKILFTPKKTREFISDLYTACDERNLLSSLPEMQPSVNGNGSTKYKVLHISSAPVSEMNYLNFDNEYKSIDKIWRGEGFYKASFDLVRIGAATQKDFMNQITQENPDLLVIGVHGKTDLTLSFATETNEEAPFSLPDFLQGIELLTRRADSRLKGILFNCCYSTEFAKEVAENHGLVNYAIGMEGLIADKVIPEFVEGFFSAFFKNKDFRYAYNRAIYSMKTNGSQYAEEVKAAVEQPKLFVKQ
jgi:hypothetical protein